MRWAEKCFSAAGQKKPPWLLCRGGFCLIVALNVACAASTIVLIQFLKIFKPSVSKGACQVPFVIFEC